MGRAQVALGSGEAEVVRELPEALRRAIFGDAGEGTAQAKGRLAFWTAATDGQRAASLALEVALAKDILALFGVQDPARVLARRGPMLDRAASALRAGAGAGRVSADVTVLSREVSFAGFFTMETVDLAFRRFDGQQSPPVRREVFVGCDAVTVLPYDPLRDRVLVIEQMRAGPLLRGDPRPWQIEPVAGRVDAGETPEAAALRETQEEAGLTLRRLMPVSSYYPSPGAVSEYFYSFVGLCDLPDGVAGVHGLAAEAEDIKGHLMPFAEALARADRGDFRVGPLVLTLNWLARHRDGLRAEAGQVI